MKALEFRWALAYLLPTLLDIHYGISRVHYGGLQQDAVGGVFWVPLPLFAAPQSLWRVKQVASINLVPID